MSDIGIECHSDINQVPQQEWDDLKEACPHSTLFQDAAWARAWWETSRPAESELCLVTLRDDANNLVGLAPLYARTENGRRELCFLGAFHNDYNVFLTVPTVPDAFDQLYDYVLEHLGVDVFRLTEIPAWSPHHQWAVRAARRAVWMDQTSCPRLDFTLESDVSRFANKKSVKRKLNKLKRRGTVEIEHHTDPDRIVTHLPELYEQHIARWDGTDHPSLFLDETNQRFFENLVQRLPQGDSVLTRLTLDDRAVACHLGFRSDADLLWYKPAYDQSLHDCSPGEIMLSEIIRFAHSEQFAGLDFTRGDEAFKFRFTNQVNVSDNLLIYPSAIEYAWRRTDRQLRLLYRWLRASSPRLTGQNSDAD